MGVGSANVIFLPGRQPPEGPVRGGDRAAYADGRGHPLGPGRRQPADRGREADLVRPARGARDRRAGSRPGRRRRTRAGTRDGGGIAMASGRRKGAWRARERGAMAAHLRGHDHAADGAVHGAVLDFLGERLQVPVAAAVAESRVLRRCPARWQGDPADRLAVHPAAFRQRHRDPFDRPGHPGQHVSEHGSRPLQ